MQLSCRENMSHDCFTMNRIKTYNVKGRHEIICINKFINSSNLYAEKTKSGLEINFFAQNKLPHKCQHVHYSSINVLYSFLHPLCFCNSQDFGCDIEGLQVLVNLKSVVCTMLLMNFQGSSIVMFLLEIINFFI